MTAVTIRFHVQSTRFYSFKWLLMQNLLIYVPDCDINLFRAIIIISSQHNSFSKYVNVKLNELTAMAQLYIKSTYS